ncbi:MAG TPA: isoaspartyl peptidase/L-asparaginase, partial [Kofleriaceae bacterium]|nr:isoaspartyl peptidase/L-asparaginase [Kofleriaceae bacterium]
RGFIPCDPDELIVPRQREKLAEEAARRAIGRAGSGAGTVGACAVDAGGHVAAATSTGGITYKRPGRIGDTPLAGAGTYADDAGGAASATGHGESIIRVTMTRVCVDAMRAGQGASAAAWASLAELARVGGSGGIICCDAAGRIGAAHNSPRMAWGAALLDGPSHGAVELPRGADAHALLLAQG